MYISKSGAVDTSDQIPDWAREEKSFFSWSPSRSLLASIRAYQRHAGSGNPLRILGRKFAVLRHIFWGAITGADVPLTCSIGGGLLIPHPNGIVIHPAVTIGPNCLIFQQVTLGERNGQVPKIEGHVDIGAGAKIIGGVVVGAHAKIGANAVVLTNVADGCTAVGIPAKICRPINCSDEITGIK